MIHYSILNSMGQYAKHGIDWGGVKYNKPKKYKFPYKNTSGVMEKIFKIFIGLISLEKKNRFGTYYYQYSLIVVLNFKNFMIDSF